MNKKNVVTGYQNGIVSITSDGRMSGIKEGTSVVRGVDNAGREAVFTVNVSTISQKKTLYINRSKSRSLTYYKVNAKKAQWSSDDPDIASVSKTGKVMGLKSGKTVIRCIYNGFTFISVVYIENPALVTDERLTEGSREGQYTLKLSTVSGSEIYDIRTKDIVQPVFWKSSNRKVVFVDEYGRLTAKAKGKAVISAAVNGKQLKITVKVENLD